MVQGKRIIEAQDLPEGEKVYLRKDMFGWRLIKPIKKDMTQPWSFKNCNWPNLLFGGWRNLIMLVFIILVVLGHLHEDKLNLQAVKDNCMGICLYEYSVSKTMLLGSKPNYTYPSINLSGYGGVIVDANN